MAASDCHKLSIFGTSLSYRNREGRQAWKTEISLDDILIHSGHEIYDSCSPDEHAAIIEYLEQLLVRDHDIRSTAAKASTLIDRYRVNLFAQLGLSVLLSKSRIRIDVCECGYRARTAQTHTIHRLPWELLENPDHWHVPDPCVTVRRIVAPAVVGPELERVCSWSTSDSVNILLVVARRLSVGASRQDQSGIPSFALAAIQNAQKKLNMRQGSPRIKLEIVRPGTYQALQKHLESTTREKGLGYFHMVHFDLHGRVRNHTACLRFVDEEGKFDDKPASVVAELLAANGVPSVVMNACQSATASKGVDANLARTFAREKILNILAMSYRFSSSAATIFLTSFYQNLLIEPVPFSFSEAAGRARETLRNQRGRKSRDASYYDIQDWFVPVVYMGKRDLQITPHSWNLPSSIPHYRASFINVMDRWFSMVLSFISRLLWICLSAVFASLSSSQSSLADQARRRPQMICLGVNTFDGRQDDQDPLVLDTFILNLEHSMIRDQHIFLHGPPIAGKSFFLDRLSRLWLSTNFADRIYVIQTSMFLEGWFPRLLRYLLLSIQGHFRFLYATARAEDEGLHRDPRVVVIIDHLDQLFSGDLTSQQKAQAKARLDNFLLNVLGVARGKTYTLRPYLILVGRQGDDWMHEQFSDLDFDPTPIFLDSRPALQHLQ